MRTPLADGRRRDPLESSLFVKQVFVLAASSLESLRAARAVLAS